MIRFAASLAALAALPACSGYEEESANTITPSEKRALDDAAEMIEQRRVADGLPPSEPDPETSTEESGE